MPSMSAEARPAVGTLLFTFDAQELCRVIVAFRGLENRDDQSILHPNDAIDSGRAFCRKVPVPKRRLSKTLRIIGVQQRSRILPVQADKQNIPAEQWYISARHWTVIDFVDLVSRQPQVPIAMARDLVGIAKQRDEDGLEIMSRLIIQSMCDDQDLHIFARVADFADAPELVFSLVKRFLALAALNMRMIVATVSVPLPM